VTVVVEPVRPAPASPHAADWALVERAKAGDRGAFAELYQKHRDAIWRYIRYRVSDSWTADDLTGDVFARAYRALPNVRDTGHAYIAWLITVARNRVNDHRRSLPVRYEVPTDGVYDADQYEHIDEAPQPENVAERADLVAAVRRAVATLSPMQRRIVELRFLEQRDVAETAAATGSTLGAVKAMQFRAVRALRRIAPELEEWQ